MPSLRTRQHHHDPHFVALIALGSSTLGLGLITCLLGGIDLWGSPGRLLAIGLTIALAGFLTLVLSLVLVIVTRPHSQHYAEGYDQGYVDGNNKAMRDTAGRSAEDNVVRMRERRNP